MHVFFTCQTALGGNDDISGTLNGASRHLYLFKMEKIGMKELSLFTGVGGGLLATSLKMGWETVGYVEFDNDCQQRIRQRIDDGIIHNAPVFGDIDSFIDQGYASAYTGMVDVVAAGPPCQPFSVAGKGLGEFDPRNKIPAVMRTLKAVRPMWLLLENSPGLPTRHGKYFGKILHQLADLGYDAKWTVLSAKSVGAPHLRKRFWIVAHSPNQGAIGRIREQAHG